jgi:hypothetical protein
VNHKEVDALQEVRLATALDGDERWELVIRIAASPPFKKSPRMRQFLFFVAERSLTGHVDDITEYEIGWKVFERGEKYDPSDDSIVRTTARQLRTKVKEYFDTEGARESWILEIPKGGYTPIFTKREGEAGTELTSVPQPAFSVTAVRFWQFVAGGLAVIAIGSLLFAYRPGRRSPEGPLVARPSIVSGVLTAHPTRVIVGDFGLALASLASRHHYSVEEYANLHETFFEPPEAGPTLLRLWNILGHGEIVSLPDLTVAAAILRVAGQQGKNVVIVHTSQISARDLRDGNFILVSAPIANPWMTLFEEKLNFRYRLDDSPKGVTTNIINIHPLAGEKPTYSADASTPEFGVTYGLVARVPNLTGTGKVMLIGGLKYTGFEAAGEYATDPSSAAELAALFKVKDISQVPDFEVLIETYSIKAAPRYVKLVAFRRVND